jgi:hypothetical protein
MLARLVLILGSLVASGASSKERFFLGKENIHIRGL